MVQRKKKKPQKILQDLLNNSFSSTLPAALLMLWMSWYSVAESEMFTQKGLRTSSAFHGDNVALLPSCTNYLSAQHSWQWSFNWCLCCSCLVDDPLNGERTLLAPARLPPGPSMPQICHLFSRTRGAWQPDREILLFRWYSLGEFERCILVLFKCLNVSGLYCHGFACIKAPHLIQSNTWAFQMVSSTLLLLLFKLLILSLSFSLLPYSPQCERMVYLCTSH